MLTPYTYQNRICSLCSIQYKIISREGDVALPDGLETGWAKPWLQRPTARPASAFLSCRCELGTSSVNAPEFFDITFVENRILKFSQFYLKRDVNVNIRPYEIVQNFLIWHNINSWQHFTFSYSKSSIINRAKKKKKIIPISIFCHMLKDQVKVFIGAVDWMISP